MSECTVLLEVYMELPAAQAAGYAKGHGVLVCHLCCSLLALKSSGTAFCAELPVLDRKDLRCRPLESHLANLECNSTSAVQITHHFLELMVTWSA